MPLLRRIVRAGLALLPILWIGLAAARGSLDLPSISLADLPPEARQTLQLIDRGGPFPYRRDGIVFGNFEGRLPRHPRGYYHEYTVPTPDRHDRGPRRVVTGDGGERYYSGDHYRSFLRIRP